MPVIATIKGRRQFSRRDGIRVAIQRVADVIWILFVHASKGKTRKPLRRFGVKLRCALGDSTHGEEQERGADG
jgi:hypothetical protein